MQDFNAMGTKTVIKAKAILVFTGPGELTLTDAAVIWNKTVESYIAFGVASALTQNHLIIPLEKIANISKYKFLSGGGVAITSENGEIHKISIKGKESFNIVFEYLKSYIDDKAGS